METNCLKCHKPAAEHPRWTAENIGHRNVSPSCIGTFIGHDPLLPRKAVEVDTERAYGHTTRLPFSVRVF